MSAEAFEPVADPGDRTAEDSRVVRTFCELVRIDSPSGEEAAMAAHVVERLRAVGLRAYMDETARESDSECGNVIAELAGTVPGRTLVLCAHLDTVEPGRGIVPVVRDGVVSPGGRTILGADDKAGVAVVIEALQRVQESARPHAGLRVLLTVGEERGLQGAKALSAKDATGDLCLVLDADGEPGGIVTAAPTHYTFSATFTGRAAHAGVEPEKGASAIAMASRAICRMELGRLDDDTTANIGLVNGGGATNVVASECRLTGECRSLDASRVEVVRGRMDAAMREAADELGGTVTIAWTKEYDGFRFSDDDPLLLMVENAIRDAGIEPRRFRTGGGSDGNVLSSKGLPSLVLSSGMRDVHGMDETVATADLEAMVRVVLCAIDRAVA